jgi:membrane protein DedA with SNARE-associated domain/rhodanese-related sulfurtransferase
MVFGWVLVEQSGVPLPAPPLLVAAGAIAQDGKLQPELVLLAATAACLIADHAWFVAGRLRGRALLAGICRLSLSPDICVRRTDDLIGRHGAPLLIFAKFIPGVSAVAIPTAAAMGLSYWRFVLFDTLGALLWAGTYLGAGMIFSREVQRLLDAMAAIGGWALVVVAAAFALYILVKVAYRIRLRKLYRLVRIAPHEAAELLREDPQLLFVDARSALARQEDSRRLPQAVDYHDGDITAVLPSAAHHRTIVTFCTCPNEASAAVLADQLIKAGYSKVRVLTGGVDALTVLVGGLAAGITPSRSS